MSRLLRKRSSSVGMDRTVGAASLLDSAFGVPVAVCQTVCHVAGATESIGTTEMECQLVNSARTVVSGWAEGMCRVYICRRDCGIMMTDEGEAVTSMDGIMSQT